MAQPKSMKAGGIAIGSEVVGFAVVGILIDYSMGTLNTIPWATLILCPLGLVVALIHLMQLVKSDPQS